MEPIPLCTLTVLLNYERMISDPRFKGERLMNISIVDPPMVQRMLEVANVVGQLTGPRPSSIQETETSFYMPHTEAGETEDMYTPTMCMIHPDASSKVKALTHNQKELIYHESHGHDGCYKAIALFQYFFGLCPPGQQISIQITNEEPRLVGPDTYERLMLSVHGPKRMTVVSTPAKQNVMYNGTANGEPHTVLIFRMSGAIGRAVVVDMTRMQYGEVGKGAHGENYYCGYLSEYGRSMNRVCENLVMIEITGKRLGEGTDTQNRDRLKNCAQKVWDRWQNRANEGWCEYCGKGGPALKRCTGCKERTVRYCCKEHQRDGWKLHKFTCEKAQRE